VISFYLLWKNWVVTVSMGGFLSRIDSAFIRLYSLLVWMHAESMLVPTPFLKLSFDTSPAGNFWY
jgi:hypothetical protein